MMHGVNAETEQGTIVTKTKDIDAAPITPHGEGWYHERPLRIKQAAPEKILKLLVESRQCGL
jgi:hypothetical protein